MSSSPAFFPFVVMKKDWLLSLLMVNPFANKSKKRYMLTSFSSQKLVMLVGLILFLDPFMLAQHISVARHTAERISSLSIILPFQSLFQFLRPDADSGRATPRNSLQLPNSQVQEKEGKLCYKIKFCVYLTRFLPCS